MGKYLITGRGGSGKSTICRKLKRRGYPAYDADEVAGLCRWENRQTGEPIKVDPAGYIDYKKVAWAWQDKVFKELFDAHDTLILCGSSSNQESYHNRFDAVFVLMLDPKTHDYRLRTRDFDYGKHPKLRAGLVERHQQFANRLINSGAIGIDAMQSLEKTVDDILRLIEL
jgi:broad-specificity NMP kinase